MDTEMKLDRNGLSQPFHRSAIKQREGGGGKKFSYLQLHTVINRLNKCCPQWDWRIVNVEQKDRLVIVTGELSIEGMGTRTGVGVQEINEKAIDLYKGASGDGIKKAATLFGVGIELYGDDYEALEETRAAKAKPKPKVVAPVEELTGYDGECPECSKMVFFAEKSPGVWSLLEEDDSLHEHQTQPDVDIEEEDGF